MAAIASLSVQLTAKTGRFSKGMKRASKDVSSFRKRLRSSIPTMSNFGRLITGAAVIGSLTLFSRKIATTITELDTLAKTASKLGILPEKLAGLRHAAELSGVSTQQLDLGIQRMGRRMAEAAIGTGEAKDAIKELGLDAKQLNTLSITDQFIAVAGAMESVTNANNRLRLAFKLFDSEGVALVNVLNQGEDAIKGMMEEARRLGIAVGGLELENIVRAKDAMTRMAAATRGVVNVIAIELAPIITAIGKKIVSMGTDGETAAERMHNGMAQVFDLVGSGLGVFDSINIAIKSIGASFTATFATIARKLAGLYIGLARLPTPFQTQFKQAAGLLNDFADTSFEQYAELQRKISGLQLIPEDTLKGSFERLLADAKASVGGGATPSTAPPTAPGSQTAIDRGEFRSGKAGLIAQGGPSRTISAGNQLIADAIETLDQNNERRAKGTNLGFAS